MTSKAKHVQVSDKILSTIEQGLLLPGDRLPSEDRLTIEHNVSLGTIQRALRNLVEIGVIERHHGNGTFVSGARAKEVELLHFRFMSAQDTALLPVYFKILEIKSVNEIGPWKSFLYSDSDVNKFIRIHRLVNVNDEFSLFSEFYLPNQRFHKLCEMDSKKLSGISIRDFLARNFNAPTLNIRQTMNCQPLPPRVTQLIDVQTGQYGLNWVIESYSYRNLPIMWQRVFVPPTDRVVEISAMNKL